MDSGSDSALNSLAGAGVSTGAGAEAASVLQMSVATTAGCAGTARDGFTGSISRSTASGCSTNGAVCANSVAAKVSSGASSAVPAAGAAARTVPSSTFNSRLWSTSSDALARRVRSSIAAPSCLICVFIPRSAIAWPMTMPRSAPIRPPLSDSPTISPSSPPTTIKIHCMCSTPSTVECSSAGIPVHS